MMNKIFLAIAFAAVCTHVQAQPGAKIIAAKKSAAPASQTGYLIHAAIAPFKNKWIYLGSYYGKNRMLVDSAFANSSSETVFKGTKKLPGGIYFFVSPGHVILFEILMDNVQHFSVKGDSSHPDNITITGSPENTLFSQYTKYLSGIVPQITKMQDDLKYNAHSKTDSMSIQHGLRVLNMQLNNYRDSVVINHPKSLLALFFQTVRIPDVPKMPVLPDGSLDSLYPGRYVKEHFWDNVNFYDDRLVRTPFFEPKLDDYFKYYVSQDPDSIIAEVNYMLLSAREGKDIFKFLLGKFTDKYINPEIMGQDKVFLFLFNNFYSKGDTAWLTAKQKEYIFNRAYSIIANQINEPAPQLDLIDTAGRPVSLYNDVKAPLTFVVFWDPTCSHCKIEVPQLDSIYEAKWKALGIKIFAVNTNENTKDEWISFIADNHLNGWYHAWQTRNQRVEQENANQPNYRQLYDIYQTPTMYLLDADKRIIAKKLSIEQFDNLIDTKIKKPASSN